MKYNVIMPQLTETMEQGTMMAWHKQVGDYVNKREHLFDVETDKALTEVEAVDAGYLCQILVAQDQSAAVGAVLAVLADSPEEC